MVGPGALRQCGVFNFDKLPIAPRRPAAHPGASGERSDQHPAPTEQPSRWLIGCTTLPAPTLGITPAYLVGPMRVVASDHRTFGHTADIDETSLPQRSVRARRCDAGINSRVTPAAMSFFRFRVLHLALQRRQLDFVVDAGDLRFPRAGCAVATRRPSAAAIAMTSVR